MKQIDWNRLPRGYRRWPVLAGVAAGLWLLVFVYLGRAVFYFFQDDHRLAGFSVMWSIICLGLGQILYIWAKNTPAD
ncbi:hypothetical protein LLH00_15165 [bacterium]|nr:hypothetical protein [bacterium]